MTHGHLGHTERVSRNCSRALAKYCRNHSRLVVAVRSGDQTSKKVTWGSRGQSRYSVSKSTACLNFIQDFLEHNAKHRGMVFSDLVSFVLYLTYRVEQKKCPPFWKFPSQGCQATWPANSQPISQFRKVWAQFSQLGRNNFTPLCRHMLVSKKRKVGI